MPLSWTPESSCTNQLDCQKSITSIKQTVPTDKKWNIEGLYYSVESAVVYTLAWTVNLERRLRRLLLFSSSPSDRAPGSASPPSRDDDVTSRCPSLPWLLRRVECCWSQSEIRFLLIDDDDTIDDGPVTTTSGHSVSPPTHTPLLSAYIRHFLYRFVICEIDFCSKLQILYRPIQSFAAYRFIEETRKRNAPILNRCMYIVSKDTV